MLNDDDISGKVKIAILIGIVVVAVMSCGCSSDASPSGAVETFASLHGAGNFGDCYLLMSEEYTNSTNESTFKEKMSQCKPTRDRHYEFIEVKNEKIDGDSASVEVIYVEKLDISILDLHNPFDFDNPKNKTKTINLTKEDNGWRLIDIHCELKSK